MFSSSLYRVRSSSTSSYSLVCDVSPNFLGLSVFSSFGGGELTPDSFGESGTIYSFAFLSRDSLRPSFFYFFSARAYSYFFDYGIAESSIAFITFEIFCKIFSSRIIFYSYSISLEFNLTFFCSSNSSFFFFFFSSFALALASSYYLKSSC